MPEDGARARGVMLTRERIAETALDLFQRQGYAETTIDQIAAAAGVGRRTVFHHFPSKESMLLDHLVVRREIALQRLGERPPTEALLASLLTVLRGLAEEGFDRRLLAGIRAVLTTEPRLAREVLSVGGFQFEKKLVEALRRREGETRPYLEIHAVTFMAASWFTTATHLYLVEGRHSLLEYLDQVVATCTSALVP